VITFLATSPVNLNDPHEGRGFIVLVLLVGIPIALGAFKLLLRGQK
jgi:hypothetical protein